MTNSLFQGVSLLSLPNTERFARARPITRVQIRNRATFLGLQDEAVMDEIPACMPQMKIFKSPSIAR